MRGLDKARPTQDLVDAMRIHYNFIRPHQALHGQTPVEVAGINLNLGENKIETLMGEAAVKQRNVEPFVTELGIRINKLQVVRQDDYIEIKPKVWLDKKNWREISEILVKHGFEWKSCNIDSCWIKNRE